MTQRVFLFEGNNLILYYGLYVERCIGDGASVLTSKFFTTYFKLKLGICYKKLLIESYRSVITDL